jgi:hypothetical protein
VKFGASLHCRFDNPTNAVREHGTNWGTKAKPLSVGTRAALLSEQARRTATVGFGITTDNQ